jgi:hypothetical protein
VNRVNGETGDPLTTISRHTPPIHPFAFLPFSCSGGSLSTSLTLGIVKPDAIETGKSRTHRGHLEREAFILRRPGWSGCRRARRVNSMRSIGAPLLR